MSLNKHALAGSGVKPRPPRNSHVKWNRKWLITDHWSLIISYHLQNNTHSHTCLISLTPEPCCFPYSTMWQDSCGSWKPKPKPNPKLHWPAWEARDPWGISACLPRSRRRTKSKPGDSMIWRASARSLEETGPKQLAQTHLNFLFATMCQSWIYLLHCPLQAKLKHTCSATSGHDPDPLRKPPPPARSFLITKLGLQGK